ncbi:hypothetical protein V172_15875 [Citrobacter freundii RLS1]|jgi:hypothetical protein|nr:hypothetical protein V172_15875 [Citrobacter freundii RLS1]
MLTQPRSNGEVDTLYSGVIVAVSLVSGSAQKPERTRST